MNLGPDQINTIELNLRNKREALLKVINERLHHSDGKSIGFANHNNEEANLAEADLLNDTEIAQIKIDCDELQKIEDALTRIKHDDFGICKVCSEPIPFKRITAQPEATLCLKCQEEYEKVNLDLKNRSY